MTKKHFDAIAKTLVRMQAENGMTKVAYNIVCRQMGYQLEDLNPRFDIDKWDSAVKWVA